MRRRVRAALMVTLAAGLLATPLTGSSMAGTATTQLTANLNGHKEVPGPGDPDGDGMADITLDATRGRVCFDLSWRRIGKPIAAHIHRGPAGVAGPVKVLFFETPTPLPSSITEVKGCVRGVDSALIQRIVDNPARFYVNIHTRAYPDGAIRGQLG